jgi:hypothetical protein
MQYKVDPKGYAGLGDDPHIPLASPMGAVETGSGTSRISSSNSTSPLKNVDLPHLPDEATPFVSTEILSDAAQTNVTPGPMESEGDYIRRCYQQVTTPTGIDMDKFLCLRQAQLVTDSIMDVALERQLNPKWRGMDIHLTRNLITPVWNPETRQKECGITRMRARHQLRKTKDM